MKILTIIFKRRSLFLSIKKILFFALDLLFPISCIGCELSKTYLCQKCFNQIKVINRTIYSTSSIPNLTDSVFSCVITAASYRDSEILQKAIQLFKYRRIKQLGEILGELIKKRMQKFLEQNPGPWTVIPIPLHKRKFLERGFNQNEILMRHCESFESIAILTDKQNPLKRQQYTKSQTKLSGERRIMNVQNIFTVIDCDKITNKKIIIVDDIITTGATLKEAAQALKKAGANQIVGFVLAFD